MATLTAGDQAPKVHPDHLQLLRMLDEAPLRLPHYLAWVLSCGGTLLDGVSLFMLGLAIPLLRRDMALDAGQIALLAAALVGGAIAGSTLGGHLADRLGRKAVFLLDMGLLTLAAGLGALAWSPPLLIGTQFAVGLSVGMDFPVSASYMAECMPQRARGRMMVATIAAQSVGLLLAAALAVGVLHLGGEEPAWRLFFTIEAGLAVLYLLARLDLPESPRWLMSHGRNREAVRALERLAPADRGVLDAMATRLGSRIHHVARVPRGERPMGLGVLFGRAYRRRALLSTLPWFLMDIATYGVGLFTPVLLAALRSRDAAAPGSGLEALAARTGEVDVFLLLGFVLGIWAIARFGRIRMQLTGFAGMSLGMGMLFASTVLPGAAPRHLVLVLMGFVLFNLSMNMGPNSTTYILPAELFPTQVRASAAGLAAASAKIGATLGVSLLPLLQSHLGIPAVLALMIGVSILGLILTYAFRVEGQGRTLEKQHGADLP